MRPHDQVDDASASGLADRFEQHRPHVRAVAARVLGSSADAEDAVQESWLRLSRVGDDDIDDLRAWLTTVTTRISLDILRRRRCRRDASCCVSLDDLRDRPERSEPPDPGAGPEDEALLTESVSIALRIVGERLNPAERVAFVLHDVFGVPFASIASLLGRTTAAAKMLASRARRHLRDAGDPPDLNASRDRSAVDAFFAAASTGDLTAMLAVLDPDLVPRRVLAFEVRDEVITRTRSVTSPVGWLGSRLRGSADAVLSRSSALPARAARRGRGCGRRIRWASS